MHRLRASHSLALEHAVILLKTPFPSRIKRGTPLMVNRLTMVRSVTEDTELTVLVNEEGALE